MSKLEKAFKRAVKRATLAYNKGTENEGYLNGIAGVDRAIAAAFPVIYHELDEKDAEIDRLRQKTCQAYQVIGCLCLLDNPELPNEKEAERALDYFSDDKLFDEDFLPFNPFEKSGV